MADYQENLPPNLKGKMRPPNPKRFTLLDLHHSQFDAMTKAEELEIFRRVALSDRRAIDRAMLANIKFVAKVANNYRNLGLSYEDLVGEGMIGLRKAVAGFNPGRGFKFISYAVWWVRQSIIQALQEKSGNIVTPALYSIKVKETDKKRARIERDEIKQGYDKIRFTVRIGELESSGQQFAADGPAPDDCVEIRHAKASVAALMSELSPKESLVISSWFGLKTGEKANGQQIAESLGVSRERVRQIRDAGIRKMGHAMRRMKARENIILRKRKEVP